MPLFEVAGKNAQPIKETTFQAEGMLERRDLQRIVRDSIEMLVPGGFVLAEEFGDWEDSRRRIDLLCIDRSARIVVVELKRTEDGGHMELQALRYAAMVSRMTFAAAVRAHQSYLKLLHVEDDAEQRILGHLGWDEPQEEEFGSEVVVVLAAAEFSKELTTSVIWLNEHDLDIRCVRIKPHKFDEKIILDVQQIVPLPEAADYQVRLREKEREERRSRSQNRDLTRFRLTIGDKTQTNLPKRSLALLVIREAILRGADPLTVHPSARRWVIVPGEHESRDFLIAAATDRLPECSSSEIDRFFTDDDQLIAKNGKTYALTKMWGSATTEQIDEVIKKFGLNDVSYEPFA